MIPPGLLHASGSVLIVYMFESLRVQMGGGKDRDFIDKQHIQISSLINRQVNKIFQEDQWEMDLLMELNVSLQNKREIFSNYCVLHIQKMEAVLWRDL